MLLNSAFRSLYLYQRLNYAFIWMGLSFIKDWNKHIKIKTGSLSMSASIKKDFDTLIGELWLE